MLGKSLGHYRIISRLGAGGMGEVYAAEDTKLKRHVALKVLPPEMADDPVRRARFQREAEAVAALDHPNIVTIYSIETASVDEEGSQPIHFLTMQMVRGKTLGQQIPADGLSLEQLLELAIPLADALSAAHSEGITHRDLKPGNIMVGDDGRVRVLDFGLAKLRQSGDAGVVSDDAETLGESGLLTRAGTVVGTAPYMSPEQVKGLSVDPRSDIFSLGSIFYEMLVGRRPFSADTSAEVMSAILRDTPASLSEGQKTLPPAIDRVVQRCLEKNPDDRYPTAGELHRDLKNLRSETTLAGGADPLPLPDKPSLAVLPFVSLGSDPEQDYLATGLWADINADLVQISGLFLISQTSTGLYKGKSVSPQQVGRELGVRYVLDGTVRRAGNRVRITAQLVETRTGEPVWAERFDRELDDLFALQDEINEEIVTALDVKLLRGEGQRIMRRSLKHPRARDIYYQALEALFTFKREDLVEARRLLCVVAEIEPDSPLTYVFTAFSHYFEASLGLSDSPEESADRALALAEQAIELDDPTGTAHMIKGMVHLMQKRYDEALKASEISVGDRPNCPWAWALRGAIFNYAGKPAEGIELARMAIRHTPLVPPIFPAVLATSYYLCGRTDEAVEAARSAINIEPDNLEAHVMLAAALAASGRADDAKSTLREIYRIKTDFALDEFGKHQPYKDPSILERLLTDLRSAGLS